MYYINDLLMILVLFPSQKLTDPGPLHFINEFIISTCCVRVNGYATVALHGTEVYCILFDRKKPPYILFSGLLQ